MYICVLSRNSSAKRERLLNLTQLQLLFGTVNSSLEVFLGWVLFISSGLKLPCFFFSSSAVVLVLYQGASIVWVQVWIITGVRPWQFLNAWSTAVRLSSILLRGLARYAEWCLEELELSPHWQPIITTVFLRLTSTQYQKGTTISRKWCGVLCIAVAGIPILFPVLKPCIFCFVPANAITSRRRCYC